MGSVLELLPGGASRQAQALSLRLLCPLSARPTARTHRGGFRGHNGGVDGGVPESCVLSAFLR